METGDFLAFVAGLILIVWGAAHLAPTRAVADSFGPISVHSRRILVMEWIAEGVTHLFLGLLAIVLAAIEGSTDPAPRLVYRVSTGALLAPAALTGARTPVARFKLCLLVLATAAALLVIASLIEA